jgi:hypothetical protein
MLPIFEVSLLGMFGLLLQVLPFLPLLLLSALHGLFQGLPVLEGVILDLPGIIQLDQVQGLEDVVHFLLVHLAVGVVPRAEGGDLVVDGIVIFLFLHRHITTME